MRMCMSRLLPANRNELVWYDEDMELFHHPPSPKQRFLGVLIAVLVTLCAGLVGNLLGADAIATWYASLEKPSWNPPNWIFGPVWTILYVLMGIAAYLVWEKTKDSSRRAALVVYGVQLFLNALWSIIFFTFKQPAIAFGEIVIMWITILATIILFWRIRPLAAALLLPYIAWVTFASVLNFAVWQLN